MKKDPYKIISVLISTILFICIMPFYHVKADSNTYEIVSGCVTGVSLFQNNTTKYGHVNLSNVQNEYRAVSINSDGGYIAYFINTVSFSYRTIFETTEACGINDTNSTAKTTTFNGVTYYYANISANNANTGASNFATYFPSFNKYGNYNAIQSAIYYTFGDGAVAPEPPAPPIQAGELTYNYYTDFASNQQNSIGALQSNRDTITWDYDTTDSNIPGIDLKVDIRAVPSKYYASTENNLKSLTWNDLSLDIEYSADLGSYQMNWNNRKVSYTWGEVVDKVKLNSNLPDYYNDLVNSWNFKFIKLNDLWYWTGWVYQIRLNTYSGDYTGEWQTIYQVSSAPPEGSSETINYYVMNGTGVTEPIYQTIQNINNQNNVTNNTWYVNGSPYSIDNDSGQNWWETLLQFISDLVGSILSFLGSIFDSVITGVLELVNNLGINFLEVFSNLINRIVELFGNIDLTGQNYLIPEEYTENLNTFNIWTTGLFNVFINSGLGLLIFIPFILLIVRLFI